MQPNEPSQQPIQAPAQSEPAPQLPQQWTPGVANGYSAPTEPQPAPQDQPAQQPQAQQPTEPQPTPQVNSQANPQEPSQSVPTEPVQQPVQSEPAPQPQMTYDEYLDSLTKDMPAVELPKPTEVDNGDPEGLTKFFEDYGQKILEQARQEQQKQTILQNAERDAWNDVFTKYPEIQKNQDLRDTIHNIRMGAYSRGKSLSPIQAADALVGTLHTEYKKGVNDTNVQTRVVDSQPLNGGGQAPAAPEVNYEALQTGGEQAAVAQLEALMRAGKL